MANQENNIRRSRERVERADPPKDGDNFVFIGWGGVLGAKLVIRKEK